MLIKNNYFLLVPLAAAFALSSCGGDKAENIDENAVGADTAKVETISAVPETFFQVPSPGEMLTFIKMVGGKNNKNISFLNSPSNLASYSDAKSKALNFGVYSCDLSYCSIFEIGAEALKYFKSVKQLGDQIGVSTAIKPEMLKRLEGNLGNPDSLSVISDDIYMSSFETLETGKQGNTMCLVVAGGWIESLYIATSLAKYEANSPIVERLADQKYTLENLIDFLKKYESDANTASVLVLFKELKTEFDKIGEQENAASETKGKSKKVVLGGGKSLVLSAEQYKIIVAKIASIRNSFTQVK